MLSRCFVVAALLTAVPAVAQQADPSGYSGHMGASVMPFDLVRSTHVFTPTFDGGTQEVVSKDGDPTQIALIRDHLRMEGQAFARGDYADPASIRGQAMPGLAALRAAGTGVHISFEQLADGARLRFTTPNPELVTALHQWFAAQVHDHGQDAMMN